MDLTTILYISGGTLAMIFVMLLCRREYPQPIGRGILSSVFLMVIGVAGVKLMYFIENGDFSGLSFFGAVFFIPLLALPVVLLPRTKYLDYLDVAAPSVAVMLAVMKVNCMVAGCCRGKILTETAAGEPVRFPSQLFEMIAALAIAALLLYMVKRKMLRHKLYPVFMLLYGTTRFVLNLFRETDDFWLGLGIGNLWAVAAALLGLLWLLAAARAPKSPRP